MRALRSPYVLTFSRYRQWLEHERAIVIFLSGTRSRRRNTLAEACFSLVNEKMNSTAANLISFTQADKLQTLIGAANVPEIEPIWTSIFAKVNI